MTASAARQDADLVQRAKAGEQRAFEELVVRYQDRIYTVAVRVLGNRDDALDASQECFLKAYRALHSFDGRSAFYTWLFRIAVNAARSYRRKVRRRKELPMEYNQEGERREPSDDGSEQPLENVLQRERQEVVRRALAELDGETASIIVLKDIQGMRYEEMAEVLECPLGSVKSRLFRARKKLRQKLEKYIDGR